MNNSPDKGTKASLSYLTKEGLRNIRSNKLMSLASIAVLMSCLVMVGVASLLFLNINHILNDISQQNVIMVYIEDDATDEEITAMGSQIEAMSNVKSVLFVPKENAFPEIMESLGSAAVLFDGMESELLPDAYEVTLSDMELYDSTVEELSLLDNIIQLRHNRDFAEQLNRVGNTLGTISVAVIVMLLVVSLFIISNTIKITMYNRRLEIKIMKSVGATKWFIRWPFMVEGVVLGVISGTVSLGLVFAIYQVSVNAIADLMFVISAKPLPFENYALVMLAVFVAVGVATGALGSLFSMNKYLKEQSYESDSVNE